MKDELKLPNDERLFWFLMDIARSEGVEADAAVILCRYFGYISITRSGHTTPVNEPHAWLIRKGGYYYRPNRAGYTTSRAEAGRYTEVEARKEAEIEPWHMSAVPADDAPAFVFTYRNHRGVSGVRRMQPIGVRFGSTEWHPEPQWLLRAFDLDKDSEREFAMSEIAPAAGPSATPIGWGLVVPMDEIEPTGVDTSTLQSVHLPADKVAPSNICGRPLPSQQKTGGGEADG